VDQPALSAADQAALTALLDDPSPVVREALRKHFERTGPAGADFLQALAAGPDGRIAQAAHAFLRDLRLSDPVADFHRFIQSQNYELESGAILLNRIHHPGLDVAKLRARLDKLAERCLTLPLDGPGLRAHCQRLNQVLFTELGLHGNEERYDDPRNSFLDEVLDRRTGLPIALAIVYLLVAQRVGLELEPVGAPGHFLIGAYEPEGPFFIDAFHGGRLLEPEEVFARLRSLNHTPQLGDLAPTPVREVLSRCCRNLAHHYAADGNEARAALFAKFTAEFESVYERSSQP